MVDDCSVKLGRVAWVQSGFRGRDSAVLLRSKQRGTLSTTVNLKYQIFSKIIGFQKITKEHGINSDNAVKATWCIY